MISRSGTDAVRRESPDRRLLVVVATYNEIENLPELIEAILMRLPQSDILVIDDGSPDGTGKWVDIRKATEPRLACIHREGKLGLGSATVAGMNYAIESGYEWMITMDADFSHSPEDLPKLFRMIKDERDNIDVAIGSRYVKGGEISGWPLRRRVMSRCVNTYARLCLSLPVRDCSGAFRAYRVAVLESLPPAAIRSRGYAYLEEILWRLKRNGAQFVETPIHFRDRTRGHTKINWKEAVAALYHILRFGISNWFGRKQPSNSAAQD